MSNINIFRIDNEKETSLDTALKKYNCYASGTQELDDFVYRYELYVHNPNEEKDVSWNWIVKELGENLDSIKSQPCGLLKIKLVNKIYLLSFGHAFFTAEKYCDKSFGFKFAKRIEYAEIKTTTLVIPNSKRNRTVNTFNSYNNLDFDSGESFAKIKIKILDKALLLLIKPSIEIGSSIKCTLNQDKLKNIIRLILKIEEIEKQKVINEIPLFNKVKDVDLLNNLENKLISKMNIDDLKLSLTELDIIGAIEIFNTNEEDYHLHFKRKSKHISNLSVEELCEFIKEENIPNNEILNIKVYDSDEKYYRKLHDLIDYSDDVEKCILCNGVWYQYNNDYIQHLDKSMKKIETIYSPQFDLSKEIYENYFEKQKKKDKNLTKNKLYRENAFNQLREEDGFFSLDRTIEKINNNRFEPMDLYKDHTMYSVKIGNSSGKLTYVIDQSLTSLKLYDSGELTSIKKDNKEIPLPKIENICIWIILEREKHIEDEHGNTDLSKLNMISLKASIANWSREVLLSGKKTIIRINYTYKNN